MSESDEDTGPETGKTDDVIEHMYRPFDLYFKTQPGTFEARQALDHLLSVWRPSFQSKGVEHVGFEQEAG